MGFFRRKWMREHHDQASFDLIDLHQFRSTSCRYVTGYIVMWIMIVISLAVYASDIYTAVILLAYDRWSNEIKPIIPFKISKWLFSGCIILSFVLLFYEYLSAWRSMRSKNVALVYSNPISRNIYSIKGYRYFCLFAKITKARSKVEYLALFTYFTFKGWVRLIFADSPRQVINALTLYSVLKINGDFVDTIKHIADDSYTQAIVLGLMAFSVFIWALSVIQFIIALICAFPLYVHIDKTCSGLEEFCCVRINRRIARLVEKHHKKGLVELKEANKKLAKQPTLPTVVLDNEEQTSERFEDILGDQGKSTKKYVAFKKDADVNAETNNPFRNLHDQEQQSRTGYGYSHPDAQDSSSHLLSHTAPSRGPTPISSQQSLRSYASSTTMGSHTGNIQKYPGPSRSGSGRSDTSNSSASTLVSGGGGGGGNGAGRYNHFQPPPQMSPVYEQNSPGGSILSNGNNNNNPPIPIPTANSRLIQPNDNTIPVRSVQQSHVHIQESSPEATLPPRSVTFDQYMPSPNQHVQFASAPNAAQYGIVSPNAPTPPPRAPQRQQYPNPYQQPPANPYYQPAVEQGGRPTLTPIRTDLQPRPHPPPQQRQRQMQPPPSSSSSHYSRYDMSPETQRHAYNNTPPQPQPQRQPTLPKFDDDLMYEPTPTGNSHLRYSRPMPEPTLPNFGVDNTPRNSTAAAPAAVPPPPRPNFGGFELNQGTDRASNTPYQPQPQSQPQPQQPTIPKIDLDDDLL